MRQLRRLTAAIVSRLNIHKLAAVFPGAGGWSGGVNLANRLSETFAVLHAPGLEGAYVNGQKYRTTNRNGVVVYDGLTPYRENHLMLDVSNTNSKTDLQGNRRNTAPYRGQSFWRRLIPTNVNLGISGRSVPMVHR